MMEALTKENQEDACCSQGKNPSDKEVDTLFKKGDLDNDGKIDLQEFIKHVPPFSSEAFKTSEII